MACIVDNKQSATVRDAFDKMWIRHYGWPLLVVTDQGPEFTKDFAKFIGGHACVQHFIDSQSPWQQGRTEKAGDSLKEDLRDTITEAGIVTIEDVLEQIVGDIGGLFKLLDINLNIL